MTDNKAHPERTMVSADSMPVLPPHIRLYYDKVRDAWVLLAPERLLTPDEIALEVIRLCDGKTTVAAISKKLAREYNASEDEIRQDIQVMLQDLVDKDFMNI